MDPRHDPAARPHSYATETIRDAVREGIREAVADPDLWAAAGAAMRSQAQSAAGGLILGGLRQILGRLAWVLVIGGGVYLLGGWSALAGMVKSQIGLR